MSDVQYGLIDNWLRHIKDVSRFNQSELDSCSSEEKFDRLCELNVLEQVHNVCHTTIVKNAWKGAQKLSVHGWIYNIENGILKNLSSQNSLS